MTPLRFDPSIPLPHFDLLMDLHVQQAIQHQQVPVSIRLVLFCTYELRLALFELGGFRLRDALTRWKRRELLILRERPILASFKLSLSISKYTHTLNIVEQSLALTIPPSQYAVIKTLWPAVGSRTAPLASRCG